MPKRAESGLLRLRRLGHTRCELTELGLGTAALGNLYAPVDDDAARAVVDAAWSAGMRFFDTAPYYGFGLSERRIGDALRARARQDFYISTKVGRLLEPVPAHAGDVSRHNFHSPMPFEPFYDYSYDGIMRSYEDSRQRLGLARIDLLLVHDIGRQTHNGQHEAQLRSLRLSGYRALEALRDAGEVAAIGLGVNEWEICDEALDWGDFDCFLLAGRYTLLEQSALNRFLPRCADAGTSLIVGGVFNSGILAVGTRGEDGGRYYDYGPAPVKVIERVAKLEAVCDSWSVDLAAAALHFPLAHPQVTTALCGARTPRELASFIELYLTCIPAGFWQDLKDAGLIATDAPVPIAPEAQS